MESLSCELPINSSELSFIYLFYLLQIKQIYYTNIKRLVALGKKTLTFLINHVNFVEIFTSDPGMSLNCAPTRVCR